VPDPSLYFVCEWRLPKKIFDGEEAAAVDAAALVERRAGAVAVGTVSSPGGAVEGVGFKAEGNTEAMMSAMPGRLFRKTLFVFLGSRCLLMGSSSHFSKKGFPVGS
jgi:hypothetical protein